MNAFCPEVPGWGTFCPLGTLDSKTVGCQSSVPVGAPGLLLSTPRCTEEPGLGVHMAGPTAHMAE